MRRNVWEPGILGGIERGCTSCRLRRELAKIIAAWPSLPEPIRREMLAVVG
jgi:hypothetical protein